MRGGLGVHRGHGGGRVTAAQATEVAGSFAKRFVKERCAARVGMYQLCLKLVETFPKIQRTLCITIHRAHNSEKTNPQKKHHPPGACKPCSARQAAAAFPPSHSPLCRCSACCSRSR